MKYRKYIEFHTIFTLPVKFVTSCELHCTKDDDQMLMFDLNSYANINTEVFKRLRSVKYFFADKLIIFSASNH